MSWALNHYDHWLDPPDVHEICECEECHSEGYHDDNRKYWAKECDECKEIIHLEEAA